MAGPHREQQVLGQDKAVWDSLWPYVRVCPPVSVSVLRLHIPGDVFSTQRCSVPRAAPWAPSEQGRDPFQPREHPEATLCVNSACAQVGLFFCLDLTCNGSQKKCNFKQT